jgi:hypothetical protein
MLPSEVEARATAVDFWELVAFFKMRAEAEDAARKKAERAAGLQQRRR